MTLNKFRIDLFQACAESGLPIISLERCLQLLAWLYVYGGEQERCTDGGRLTAHLLHAQKRVRAEGTGVVSPETVRKLRTYISECYLEERPDWLVEICAEYGVKAKYGQEA
jgi:hypothetical protein